MRCVACAAVMSRTNRVVQDPNIIGMRRGAQRMIGKVAAMYKVAPLAPALSSSTNAASRALATCPSVARSRPHLPPAVRRRIPPACCHAPPPPPRPHYGA